MKCLNLGCGQRYLNDWINVDFISDDPNVVAFDLKKGVPFADNTIDVVYHSHVLEHFTKSDGFNFISECYRVLKPNGIIRIVVPDLEQIAKEYIKNLESARSGNPEGERNYEWIILEMYDQTARNMSGGEMAKYWMKDKLDNEDYIVSRFGFEFLNFKKSLEAQMKNYSAQRQSNKVTLRKYLKIRSIKNKLLQFLTRDKEVLKHIEVGKFRLGGEPHQWMYDEYSLKKLLSSIGFLKINRRSASDSGIVNWENYKSLDIEEGETRKPDSLFIEAIK